LDALLLRETNLLKLQSKRFRDRGDRDELNSCGRLPSATDEEHVQRRLNNLVTARSAHQRARVCEKGVEEEHGELEVRLDDLIGDSDDFLAREDDRRRLPEHVKQL
jgi:hypothetical protein